MRSRVQSKKLRAKEQVLGQRKHEAAMQDIQRRRAEQRQMERVRAAAAAQGTGRQVPANAVRGQGASSGLKFKNKHMQEFEKIKAGYNKKRGKIKIYALILVYSFPV